MTGAARVVVKSRRLVVVEVLIPGTTTADVYAAVCDVGRMAEWSPEAQGVWTGPDAIRVGDVFGGANRRGRRTWSTTCRVTRAQPDQGFAFDVTSGPFPVSAWGYEFTTEGASVRVRETWTDARDGARGWVITLLGVLATGVTNRAEHNAATMTITLNRLRLALQGTTA